MNRSLTPYSWSRHVSEALIVCAWVVVAWWGVVTLLIDLGPAFDMAWDPWLDTYLYFGTFAATIAGSSVATEQVHLRRPVAKRMVSTLTAGGTALLVAVLGISVIRVMTGFVVSDGMRPLVESGSLVTLRYSVLIWLWAGFAGALGPLVVRRGASWRVQLGAGLVAALFAGAVWHMCTRILFLDLYYASVAGPLVWAFFYTSLAWPFPDQIYAGWIRVLSGPRAGHRIPVGEGTETIERIVGHYPRGLDLHLGANDGVAELHASVLRRSNGSFAVRGLSQSPLLLKRMLEHIDLRYDVRRPAPLEADLKMEDKLIFEHKEGTTSVEFLLLPRGDR
jgi:hypothetical protein